MQIFWAIFCSIVLLLVIWGMISNKMKAKRPLSLGGVSLPKIEGAFSSQKRYLVVINSGAKFESVRMLGFAEAVSGPDYQAFWSSTRWLVLEHVDGRKSFINPYTIRYFRET